MRIFISAGEASGDMYGAKLFDEIKRLRPDMPIQAEAIGGKQLSGLGVHLIANSSGWGAMGIVESLKKVPRVIRSYLKARRNLRIGQPGLFIPIDFGFVNVKLAQYARQLGWKVLYFMPPGSWRRTTQGESLPEATDEVVTPFAWSSTMLNSIGVHAHWYGHPVKQIIDAELAKPVARDPNRIAVLPGSRTSEVKHNLAAIAKAAKAFPAQSVVEVALASSLNRAKVQEIWKKNYTGVIRPVFTEGDALGVLRRARAAVVCSGTATLEAALCQCPMVVIYRFSKVAEMEARILRYRPQFISLPNIILNRRLVPELIQRAAKPSVIAEKVFAIASDGPERSSQLEGFEDIYSALGPSDAITKTALLAISMLS